MQHFRPITIRSKAYIEGSPFCADAYDIVTIANGKEFLYANESACFAEIDPDTARWLRLIKEGGNPNSDTSRSKELLSLFQCGFFTPKQPIPVHSQVSTLNINVNNKCNLKCRYCFAGNGSYGQVPAEMSLETFKLSVLKLLKNTPSQHSCNIVLFGGEPLISRQFIYNAIEYCKSVSSKQNKRIMLDIFTNATYIPDWLFVEYEKNQNIRFMVSIDGPPRINEYYRLCNGREKLTATIEENIKKLTLMCPQRIVIRSTVSQNEPQLVECIEYFVSLGAINIVFEASQTMETSEIDSTPSIYNGICNEMDAVADILWQAIIAHNKLNVNILSEVIAMIIGTNRTEYRSECPAGKSYLSIGTNGDIYPCHYLTCLPSYKLGNLLENDLVQCDILRINNAGNLDQNNTLCVQCTYRAMCSGLCPYKAIELFPNSQEFLTANCQYWKMRVEYSLKLLSKVYQNNSYPGEKHWETRVAALRGELYEL